MFWQNVPEVNGLEAVKLILKDYPAAKIVMVSALDQKQMVLTALKLGAKHYVIKPINPENLVSLVNRVLGHVPPAPAAKVERVVINKLEPVGEHIEKEPDIPFMGCIKEEYPMNAGDAFYFCEFSTTRKELVEFCRNILHSLFPGKPVCA